MSKVIEVKENTGEFHVEYKVRSKMDQVKHWASVDPLVSFENCEKRIFKRTLNLLSGIPLYIETDMKFSSWFMSM